VSRRNARLLQLLGLLVSLVGLLGFWWPRPAPPTTLTLEQQQLIGLTPDTQDAFRTSFVLAGRDYDYSRAASPCRWVRGECVRDRIGEFHLGNRTDTIIFVSVVGSKITLVSFPRDIYLPQWQTKINAMYAYQGAEGVRRTVEEILGLPVDYYAVINIDIFQDMVDALGGVSVTVPYRMYYRDAAADLTIDFQEGPQHMSGEDAAKFVRYRETMRGDIDRIDNVKRLAYAMLARLKELNVRAATLLPELADALFSNIETNADPAIIAALLPQVPHFQIEAATLPTYDLEGNNLGIRPAEVERFLAETFGGSARSFAEAPEATLLITNRSGQEGLDASYRARLVAMGVPEDLILTRASPTDPSPTRLLTTAAHWQDADYYTGLLQTGKQQIDRLAPVEGRPVHLELILGEDARESHLALSLPETAWAQSETP
jgi:polyisoprenyl-teichoic acid--peptidoglycan teichoic acid transferase